MKKKIFTTTPCLKPEEIRQYLSNELSEDSRYEAENHMLDCPLCHDAVEGFAAHYNFEEDPQLRQIEETIQLGEETAATPQIRPVRSLLINRIAASLKHRPFCRVDPEQLSDYINREWVRIALEGIDDSFRLLT